MPRSVNSVASRARRKRMFKQAKGYFGTRKNVTSVAKNAVDKALVYAFGGRKQKKRDYRALWIARINAAIREEGMSYSVFISKLKTSNITLNRKTLADLAMNDAPAFKAIVAEVKAAS
jgi:large subunit ribosomal protein L20